MLNHCVASYSEKIANERSKVVFIRKKDAPETPLYTMEFRGDRVIQVAGASNIPPKEKDVYDIIDKFISKAKKISNSAA